MLNPEKLRALPEAQIQGLVLRTAAVQSRLFQAAEADPHPEDRELLGFLADALLQFERELRRRDFEARLRPSVEELDPVLVYEVE
jgi:hypothetical protein